MPGLPNELLHSIFKYLVYAPKLADLPSKSRMKYVSFELLALSVTNWRLRRICLPFLFANIRIRHIRDARNLKDSSLVLIQRFTRLLVISHFSSRSEEGDQILCSILPYMKRLEWVELRCCSSRSVLLKAILANPTVSTLLVEQLREASLYVDPSKVVLEGTLISTTVSPDLETCLDHLGCLEAIEPDLLNDDFTQRHFAGLQELRLSLRRYYVTFSWLSVLSSTHSSLKEISLIDDKRYHQVFSRTPTSVVQGSQRQDLSKNYSIDRVVLCRTTGQYPQGWRVTGLTISAAPSNTSLVKILTLIPVSFPKLETLTLDLDSHGASYYIDALAAVLGRCSSLRALHLHNVFRRLKFRSRCLPTVCADPPGTLDELAAHVVKGLFAFASRLAGEVLTLDTIYIHDMVYRYGAVGIKTHWWYEGWLHVLNGNRDVDGTIQCKNIDGYVYVRLGPKCISPGFGPESYQS
ncbi:hypothetical protein GGU11DRAFT_811941 [Lentinula aff. detonsa]|nr:hypothetical protein GGU11DRAFT_811941 [Lentinula aff. detonsa]